MDYRTISTIALDSATADHTEVWIDEAHEAATRFAENAVVQNVSKKTRMLAVRSAFGQQVGIATTNDLSGEAVRDTVRRAESMARSSAPDLEYLAPPGPQQYPPVCAYDPATANVSPQARADAVAVTARLAEDLGAACAGSFTTADGVLYLRNSAGLEASHRRTAARFTVSAKKGDGTGWAEGYSHRVGDIDTEGLVRRGLDKACAFSEMRDIEPGAYTVVMEPAAFGGLLGFVCWTLDAKEADEGRSAWTGRVGTQVACESFTLRSQPTHPALPGDPFIEDGLPAPEVSWIDRGVLNTLAYTRFWADKSGCAPTGWPQNTVIEGGDKSAEELVATVDRGLLITRFWYLNTVDDMVLSLTGMTRGGLFLIENGEIVAALKNLRLNDSPLGFLKRIRELGRPVLTYTEFDDHMVCPPVVIDDFHFTSGTSF
jgi:predicted Zn-dependent protease